MSRYVMTLLAATLLSPIGAFAQEPTVLFPHDKHSRVFPVCEGCHAGIVSGVAGEVFPKYDACRLCHDGRRVKQVVWREPGPRVSLLRFAHTTHRAAVTRAGEATSCLTCHAVGYPVRPMVVAGPDPARCIGCHAHRAPTHLAANASCQTCHVALAAQPRLTSQRVSRLPKPAWHDSARFQSEHGRVSGTQAASCAVCHARESCERCHANAPSVPLIANLASDSRIATLVAGREAVYDAPLSHKERAWSSTHGANARTGAASCANCHTRPSCVACHADGSGTASVAILALPGPDVRKGLGVSTTRITRSVHPANIASSHGSAAASSRMNCAQCHSEQTCSACHAAQESRRFHADNFTERHAVEVFASSADCQSCHNTERFCRDCHARTGIASSGRMNAAFHTGQANWVLSHGQAARTGMESCASCHRQADCVRCHSASGGWGVNPHRPGFRASALAARNAASCRWCHVGDLPGGGR
jgi:hypothetical protein